MDETPDIVVRGGIVITGLVVAYLCFGCSPPEIGISSDIKVPPAILDVTSGALAIAIFAQTFNALNTCKNEKARSSAIASMVFFALRKFVDVCRLVRKFIKLVRDEDVEDEDGNDDGGGIVWSAEPIRSARKRLGCLGPILLIPLCLAILADAVIIGILPIIMLWPSNDEVSCRTRNGWIEIVNIAYLYLASVSFIFGLVSHWELLDDESLLDTKTWMLLKSIKQVVTIIIGLAFFVGYGFVIMTLWFDKRASLDFFVLSTYVLEGVQF